MRRSKLGLGFSLAVLAMIAALLAGTGSAMLGSCGPFTDFTDPGFCPFVLEIFYLGITTGTNPTTYDPTSAVTRLQMAAFLSRTVDRTLQRGSRRAAHERFWSPQNASFLGLTTVGAAPRFVKSDGADLWVSNSTGGSATRVRGSDGAVLGTWTGMTSPQAVGIAMGRVFMASRTSPNGMLHMILPDLAPGGVTTVATNLGNSPNSITFDGAHVWTINGAQAATGSVSIVTPGASPPWTVTTVTTGFSTLAGSLFDGSNVWVTDAFPGFLYKLDSSGAITTTVSFGAGQGPLLPLFDGTNIWVPLSGSNSLAVVRASTGTILQTLTGNGMSYPTEVAFDGERILVTNQIGDTVSLWKAADLTVLGNFATGPGSNAPFGACSDGLNFWIVLSEANKLARF